MKPARWGLPWLGAALAAVAALVALLVTRLGTGGGPGAGSMLLSLGAAGVLGYLAGERVGHSLRRERAALLERARGEAGAGPLAGSRIREVVELVHAADLVGIETSRQATLLERQGANLTTLVDSVTQGLLSIDARGRITFLNPAAATLLGLPSTAAGRPLSALVRSHELRQIVERALRGERVAGSELALGERRVLVTAQPLPGRAHARDGGAVVSLADLTQLRRLEGVRRDFVANVSHELKTPLTSIRGYVETLLADDPSPEIRRQFLEVVHDNARRLQRIVDDLLDLSVIESGSWQPQAEPVDATEVVREAWAACGERASRQGVHFEAPAEAVRVVADAHALRQVLGNLFDNALRHTPPGGRVTVSAPPVPDAAGVPTVSLQVSDTGTGIPGDALPRIFERFYRVDPARSRAEGGTGLGLAIVKHMVEGMGGEVRAASELGKGTTIEIRLPAAP